jgi:2-polyprenyl-3-methyl-5-hydroxy-6-metoxy-1,4-benzoquinol methylase
MSSDHASPEYLNRNQEYWSSTYDAPNVESFIFRFYGRILKFDYGLDGSNHERVLDYGCGQGGALRFFDNKGFNVYGVDIAAKDIEAAQRLMPHRRDQFALIDPKPDANRKLFDGNMDVVISIQTLDFMSNTDCATAIQCLYNNMKPGAFIYASMNGYSNYSRQHATPAGDGLWHVLLKTSRLDYDIYLNFVKDKDEMRKRFSIFTPIYLDYYDSSFREEGSELRYTFFGQKPK